MSMSLGNLTEEYRAHALLNELQSLYSSPYSATSSRPTIGPRRATPRAADKDPTHWDILDSCSG